jgi:hypothetical protein
LMAGAFRLVSFFRGSAAATQTQCTEPVSPKPQAGAI